MNGKLLAGASILGYSLAEPYLVETKRLDITSPDVPPKWDGTNIAFITDIHHGFLFPIGRVKSLVDRVNAMNPDVILLGGDYVHSSYPPGGNVAVSSDYRGGGAEYIIPCFAELARLQAPLGKYGVRGNHDNWADGNLTRACMAGAGIVPLDNQAIWILRNGCSIKVGGVGDLWTDIQDVSPTINDVADGDFVMLLSHNPDFAEQMADERIDWMICGHTHGGTVTLFGKLAPFVPSKYGLKYLTGAVRAPHTNVLVSNGLGTNDSPIRFCARPQIWTIILHSAPPGAQKTFSVSTA